MTLDNNENMTILLTNIEPLSTVFNNSDKILLSPYFINRDDVSR